MTPLLVPAAAALAAVAAQAGGAVPSGTPAVAEQAEESAADTGIASRFHGSTLTFDQSVTTQTVGIGGDYQTYDPVYEWWVAFRPRYYVIDRPADKLSVNLWMNVFLELTNSDTTTRRRELLLGPTYAWANYARTLRDRGGYKTSVNGGPRVLFPTDQVARDSGQLLGLGVTAGASQSLPLRGEGARWFRGAKLGLNLVYNYPWSRSQVPINDDLRRERVDVNGVLVESPLLSGQPNTKSWLSVALTGDVDVTRRLNFAASYVVINAWTYGVSNAPLCRPAVLGACIQPMGIPDPTTYKVSTWLTTAVSYDVLPEMSVSLGYYNLANQIGPDGTRRNPFWSPSARFFLSIVGNLDVIWKRASAKVRGRRG